MSFFMVRRGGRRRSKRKEEGEGKIDGKRMSFQMRGGAGMNEVNVFQLKVS